MPLITQKVQLPSYPVTQKVPDSQIRWGSPGEKRCFLTTCDRFTTVAWWVRLFADVAAGLCGSSRYRSGYMRFATPVSLASSFPAGPDRKRVTTVAPNTR